jgi:glycosyltransferase involved in cell wall biosynthesis
MIRVAHVRDEDEPGGVARMLDFLTRRLGPPFEQTTVQVQPMRLAPFVIDADVLVVHYTAIWQKLPYLAALRALRPARPLILVEHSYTDAFIRAKVAAPDRFAVMLRQAYGLATHVVAVSEGQARWLRRERLVPEGKLSVIRSATDLGPLYSVPLPQPDHGPLHLGAYGRFAEQKGFDVLIEAMRRVPEDRVRLSVRGLGPGRADLCELAAGLAHVAIGGAVHDVADFLGTLHAVAVPSRWEAFGQVAAEARAAGRPVIVSDLDGLSEQVSAASGLRVPAENPAALADAIMTLAMLDVSAMGAAAGASVRDHGTSHLVGWRDLLVDALPAALRPRRAHAA